MTTTARIQRYVGVALAALLLCACNVRTGGLASPSRDASTAVPMSEVRQAPEAIPLFARLGLWGPPKDEPHTARTSGALTILGTWLRPPSGPLFVPLDTLDPRNAMVYIYRPSTAWEDQELQAPSFFVDGTKVFGIKSGSYTWLELPAGTFTFSAKRPFVVLFIKTIFKLPLKVEGGNNYYLRYSEDKPFDYVAENLNPDDFMRDGFLQQVPESVALAEIASLKLDHEGVYFTADGSEEVPQQWAPFQTFPETGVDPEDAATATAAAAAEDSAEDTIWGRTKAWIRNLF